MLDALLWRLLDGHVAGTRVYDLAKIAPLVLIGVAIVGWTVLERRSRNVWRLVPAGRASLAGGPYREGSLPTHLERAPALVRVASLLGISIGALGIVWPIALIVEIVGRSGGAAALGLEALGTVLATWSLVTAVALLRGREHPASGRAVRGLWNAIAIVLAMASLAFALGALDGLEVDVVGFKKWHETMTVGTFLRSGFGLFAGGHTGMTWRIILRMTAVFGFAHAVYVLVWTRARVT